MSVLGGLLFTLLFLCTLATFVLSFSSFIDSFQTKFGRSFLHLSNILLMVLILLSMSMGGGTVWKSIYHIACVGFIGLGIWQMFKYGILWGLGVWCYNILAVFTVVSIINAISNLMKSGKR